MIRLTNFFVKLTGWLPYLCCFRTKVYYEDKKVQGRRIKGKAIVISNHTSVYDYAVNMFVFGSRVLRCLIAEITYENNRSLNRFLKSLGGIKVDRYSHDFSFIGKACDVLKKNGVVEIFPEARIPEDNEERPLEFKPSAAYIALLSGAPIIPVYTNGVYFKKQRARVIIGKPINVAELIDENLDERANLENVSKILRDKILFLKDELERQVKQKK